MPNRFASQGRLLIAELKRRPHTYLQMAEYGLSTCPWKRVAESLRADERLIKGTKRFGSRELTTWRVVKA